MMEPPCVGCYGARKSQISLSIRGLACGRLVQNHPVAEIAKSFAALALFYIPCQKLAQLADDLVRFHGVLVHAIEAGAAFITTQIKLVFFRGFAAEDTLVNER